MLGPNVATEVAVPAGGRIGSVRVSVVIPCLNEAGNIEECVRRAQAVLAENGIPGEVVVVDNASEDGSGDIARAAGARVVDEPRRGYGNAYLAGFAQAHGDYIVMIDADLTYDFAEIPRFVRELDEGAELVMGNRMGDVQPGAMGFLSRVGNPMLSGFLNMLYRTPVSDVHCGMRALRRDLLPRLDLRSTGMEFASEMVIRAAREKLEIREVPIALHVRGGESKLSPFRDGWRHLRLMLVYSPNFLFVIPGAVMVALGLLIDVTVLSKTTIFGRQFYIHAEIAGSLLVIVGIQMVALGVIARTYGLYFMGVRDPFLEKIRARFELEHGLAVGGTLILAGLVGGIVIVADWLAKGAGSLGQGEIALLAATVVIAGVQIFFTSFLLSILGLRRRD
jgi:glycosyltransferase involved in cell wall biosynthesis